ncbi:WD repeat-containing protein 25 [Tripterygium wilfordii]|uniref:WD repeat-containing protein 25 n=1 Tax=Tripterygium wilfordii TaxID=458696 RepID=A0A7J7C1L5_TRIWF|nr:WD repeat-containing protein 25 [Tripterygium wilfordii]KAF5727998.1 WD repeat-containing protein 25 [Tripterygium wilfordii]
MDLLRSAYTSDDEPETLPGTKPVSKPDHLAIFPPSKRPKPNYPYPPLNNPHHGYWSHSPSVLRPQAPIVGRYVSKREQALSASVSQVPVLNPDPNRDAPLSSSPGSIRDSDLPHSISSLLRHQGRGYKQRSQVPERLSIELHYHTKAVNALNWSPSRAHLLASAGMDGSVCIWNVWSRDQKLARAYRFHSAAVKDVKFSQQGLFLLSCGYDNSSRLVDIEKGLETQIFKEDQAVGVTKFHPDNSNIFLSGGSKGRIKLWDIRTGKVVHEYARGLGSILDIEFMVNGKQFISSSDVSGSNISENSIIVWDIARQVPLSNQVYVEAYTCPCIKHHPLDPTFVAQSNGNYIAIFSSIPPFKLDKYKRYESHGVSGFPIKCNFSLDGEKLVSGSSDGCIYFYDYKSSELIRKIKAYEQACIDVAFHPVIPNVLAACSWSGHVSILE